MLLNVVLVKLQLQIAKHVQELIPILIVLLVYVIQVIIQILLLIALVRKKIKFNLLKYK